MKAICRDCLTTAAEPFRRCPSCASPRVISHVELDRLTIAHMDCDAFYASVEKRDRPELRDLPVIVGGGKRGVVSTCCYIARQYGVRSAMPMFKALKACPDAVVIKPDFAKYKEASRHILGTLARLTPLIQPLSLDEAWVDLSGTERLNGGPAAFQLARAQRQIEQETGLTVSIGLAPNKFLAKIASDLDKPRGFSVIGAQEAQSFLSARPVQILPGVGAQMAKQLQSAGLSTVGDLARADVKDLARRFGEYGLRLSQLSRGQDARAVDPESERKGMSAETTFNDDMAGLAQLEDELWPLCDKLAAKARRDGAAARVVVLKLKTADFRLITRRRTLPVPTQTARTLFNEGRTLLAREADGRVAYRLIGIGMAELVDAADARGDLFGGDDGRALKTETAVDALREKFGKAAVTTGRALKR
ncbi:DNA polymerase IV [Caulobacter sp. 17J80-11]|uniref:DNA polymerase IV n=1 Tax=Caulobacter sp. 17J80-11 TaxID=2763502 RepID=UPI001653973E|nr:DNA polymerase IV [Caulobacter sp. 17J80-11]MBC6982083.1 DNA polymerase IV [Caulobacter sp. 17J80-11]